MASNSRDWLEIIQQLKLGGLTGQFAGHCAIKSWDENKLVLNLDPQHQSLQGSRAENMLCKSLSDAYNGLRVEIVVEALSAETPQQIKESQLQQKQSNAVEDIHADPYVQAMQKKFDAQVINESIKPLDSN